MSALTIKMTKVAVIVFYVVLFVGLALYDEKPNADMMREMQRPLPETIGSDNAWVAFIGLAAPKGISPYAKGEEKLRKLKDAFVTRRNIGDFLSTEDETKQGLSFQGKRPIFYDTKDKSVLEYVKANAAEVADLIRTNKELLQRYKSLSTYSRYDEPLDYSFYMPFPSFSLLRDGQRLYLIQFAVRASRGDVAGALTGIRKDMEFWRFVARNSTTLISKLISFSSLNTDLRFVAELGTFRTLNAKELALVQDVLRPFDRGESALIKAFRGETRYLYKGMEWSIRQNSRTLDNLFFKRNATNNRMYADFQEYIRLAELTPQNFALVVKKRERENDGIRRIGIPFLYNPAGEFLSVIGQSQGIHKYIERGYNLEGFRRLTWLKVHIRSEKVPLERIQQFLDGHASDFGNPYTSGPMKWDSKKGCIFFGDVSGEKPVELFL